MSGNTKPDDDAGTKIKAQEANTQYGSDVFPASPAHTAAYIRDIAQELQLMARRVNLSFLAYLLEIASEEAEQQKHKQCVPPHQP